MPGIRSIKLQRGGTTGKGTHPEKPPTEASTRVATTCHASSLFANGQTAHWIGPETLVRLQGEGREVNTLADSGSQVNMVMPGYMCPRPLCCHCMTLLITPSIWLGWVA